MDINKIYVDFKYALWRRRVLSSCKYSCINCGTKKGRLDVHHLKSKYLFPELMYNDDNGVVLCHACHWEYHKRWGISNNLTYDEFIAYCKGQPTKNTGKITKLPYRGNYFGSGRSYMKLKSGRNTRPY